MGHVADIWYRTTNGVRTPTKYQNKGARWQAVWLDPLTRKEKTKMFGTKILAEQHLVKMESDKLQGRYLDPKAGSVTFKEYAEAWAMRQAAWDTPTVAGYEINLRLHVYPTLGALPLSAITPSVLQAWIKGLSTTLAPSTVKQITKLASGALNAAVDDGRLASNPFNKKSVKVPPVVQHQRSAWTVEEVDAIIAALPARFALAADLCLSLGLRQGEIFGLAVEDIDFLHHKVHVRRQVRLTKKGRLTYALPKYRKVREVSLDEDLAYRIAAHLQAYPAVSVALPWATEAGEPQAHRLLLTTREHKALNRNYFNPFIWKPALLKAGQEASRVNGMHRLRHTFASLVLTAGVDIKTLADALGHTDPAFTLRVYTHLIPTTAQGVGRAIAAARRISHGDSTEIGL